MKQSVGNYECADDFHMVCRSEKKLILYFKLFNNNRLKWQFLIDYGLRLWKAISGEK